MNERERIGQMIKSIREEQGLTQDDIAEKCGMQKQNISRIEHGKYTVGVEVLAKILGAMGYKIGAVKE